MSIRKHRKGQKYMYSTQLFVAIVTASIVILTVGLVTLYGVSGRTVMEINNEMKKSTAETCAETVDREFSHINDVIHAVFLQDETLAQLTQDASKIPSSFTVIRHAMLSAISYSDRISCMGIYDNLKGAVNTKSGLDLPYSDYESCRDYFGSLPEAAQWQNSTWYFCEKEPVQLSMDSSNQGRAIVNYRELTPMTESTPKKLCMVLYLSESKLCDLYSYMGQGSCILSAKGTLVKFRALCEKYSLAPAELALSFALSLPGVTSLVLGSEKPEQVEQNAALLSHTASFTSEQMDEIHTMFKDTSARLLNPATWFNAQK